MSRHRDNLLHTADESKAEVERITARLQSCHCEGRRSSSKRPHHEMESERGEASLMSNLQRLVGRLDKAPEWTVNAAGPSVEGSGSRARGQEVTTELNSGAQSQGTEDPDLGPRPNIGQPRQPLILRHGSKWRIEDVLSKDSTADPIPQDVLTRLRSQIREWDNRGNRHWRKGSDSWERKCADSVSRKRATAWKDGDSHQACGNCTEARRLCVAVDKGTIELLPLHKDQDTLSMADEGYWLQPRSAL